MTLTRQGEGGGGGQTTYVGQVQACLSCHLLSFILTFSNLPHSPCSSIMLLFFTSPPFLPCSLPCFSYSLLLPFFLANHLASLLFFLSSASCRILSARELRTLLTHVEDLPITLSSLNRFQWMLGNCSKRYNGTAPELPPEAYETHYDPSFVSLCMYVCMYVCSYLLGHVTVT